MNIDGIHALCQVIYMLLFTFSPHNKSMKNYQPCFTDEETETPAKEYAQAIFPAFSSVRKKVRMRKRTLLGAVFRASLQDICIFYASSCYFAALKIVEN